MPGGILELIDAIFIASVNRCVVDSKAYSVAFKSLISIISRT